jgi:hypothetical protein
MKTTQIQHGRVYIPYSKEEVMTAPELDDDGHVPEEAERWLYAHQKSQAPEQESVTNMSERRKASRQAQQDEEGS